jgi:MFS family permease
MSIDLRRIGVTAEILTLTSAWALRRQPKSSLIIRTCRCAALASIDGGRGHCMTPNGEFRRGWKVVLAASLGVGTGLSPLPFYTIGVFVRPLSAEFGWTVDQILVALIVTTLSVLVTSPIVGILTDRYGVRRIALGSTGAFGLCFILFAFNPGSLPLFYANYALLSGHRHFADYMDPRGQQLVSAEPRFGAWPVVVVYRDIWLPRQDLCQLDH